MEAFSRVFAAFANWVSHITGRPGTFVLALLLVLVWAATGPLFNYSDVWQLVINTSTTIITFLMIFVLQNSQNRESKALQAKLDELILTSAAHDKFIGAEKLDEEDIEKMKRSLEAHADRLEDEADRLEDEQNARKQSAGGARRRARSTKPANAAKKSRSTKA